MPVQTIPADVCVKVVEAATRSCLPVAPSPLAQASPNWDAMATAIASQSNAIAWGALVLAVIVVIAGIAWGKIITNRAEREARSMAKASADDYIQAWLSEKAPGLVRERVDFILDATLGSGDDNVAADDIGKEA